MMRRFARILSLACLCLLCAAPAFAQDVLGLYFDAAATTTTAVTTAPYETVDLWLILRDGSQAAGVSSWECRVEAVSDGPAPIVTWTLVGSALNLSTAPVFQVGLGAPLPAAPAVVLATASVLVPDPAQEVAFYLHPFDPPSLQEPAGWGYPVYAPVYGTPPDNALTALNWPDGCASEPVARINDDGAEPSWSLSGPADMLEFGALREGASKELPFTLANESDTAPIIGTIAVQGAGFTVRHDGGYFTTEASDFRLNPGWQLSGSVRFTPPLPGLYEGELVVESCGQLLTVALRGVSQEVACGVSPPALEFGDVIVGQEQALTVTVSNDGQALLTIDPRISGSQYVLDLPAGLPGPLTTGATCSFDVVFRPTALGAAGATLALGEASCDQLPLTGVGVEAPPACTVTPTSLDFGSVGVGVQHNRTVTITNSGGSLLTGSVALADPPGEFSIVLGGGPYSLAGGQSRVVTVGFAPVATVESSGLLLTGAECGDVPLHGLGGEPVLSYTLPGSLGFGQVLVNSTRQLSLLIVNTGEQTISGDLQLSGEGFSMSFEGPFTLTPQTSIGMLVTFSPLALATYLGQISTGLPGGEVIQLSGEGIEAYSWEQDTVGLYFAPGWTEATYMNPGGVQFVQGYLVLKAPTATGEITGWQLCLDVTGTASILFWGFGATGVDVEGPGYDCHQFTLDSPAPAGENLLLATLDLLVVDDTFSEIRLGDAAGTPAYLSIPADQLNPVTGIMGGDIVAWLNAMPVGTETPAPVTRLLANYPNPFNPSTTLPFSLERSGPVRLAVHDLAGRRVRVLVDASLAAGLHQRVWDGRDAAGRRVPSGVYYGRLESGGAVELRKMMLVK